MRAVRMAARGRLEMVDLPQPDTGDQVLVRSGVVGICGTDAKIYRGEVPVALPRVIGHEMVGTVVEAPVGSPLDAGRRVLVDPATRCGTCRLCRGGRGNICPRGGLMGRDIDGVFAELVAVPSDRVIPVPDHVSDRASGLLQVLGTCVHALRGVTIEPGTTAVVLGLGVAGQLISRLLVDRGMEVIGVTRSPGKRRLAEAAGVGRTAAPEDLAATVVGVDGPSLVVEAVGTEATLSQAIEVAAVGGEIVVFGTITSGGTGLPYYEMYRKELRVHNPRAAVGDDYRMAVDIAAGEGIPLDDLVTHLLEFGDAPRALDLIDDPSTLKILMQVSEESG